MSISEHGGAVRYWRNNDGRRACLCQDGPILLLVHGKWNGVANEPPEAGYGWETDTRPSVSAAITRTTRYARRRS